MADFLFDHTSQIVKRLEESDHIVLFLDYDGTLVTFQARPTDVVTPEVIKTVLQQLVKNQKCQVVIVSGRKLSKIKTLVDVKGLSYAGLHGLQIEFSSGKRFSWDLAEQVRPFLKKIKKEAFLFFNDEKGIHLEDKELTLAFHYRQLPEQKIKESTEKFLEIVQRIDHKNILEIIHGAKVLEARPKGWNKGKAVEMLLTNTALSTQMLSIYIGDDTTDEDAFRYLREQGITIFVKNNSTKKTAAQYWLKNPDDVLIFLRSLCEITTKI